MKELEQVGISRGRGPPQHRGVERAGVDKILEKYCPLKVLGITLDADFLPGVLGDRHDIFPLGIPAVGDQVEFEDLAVRVL